MSHVSSIQCSETARENGYDPIFFFSFSYSALSFSNDSILLADVAHGGWPSTKGVATYITAATTGSKDAVANKNITACVPKDLNNRII